MGPFYGISVTTSLGVILWRGYNSRLSYAGDEQDEHPSRCYGEKRHGSLTGYLRRLGADAYGRQRIGYLQELPSCALECLPRHTHRDNVIERFASERVSRMVFVDGLSDGPATCHLLRQQLATAHPDALARAVSDTTTDARAKRSDCDLAFRALRGVDAKAFLDGLQFHDSTFRKLQDSVDAASGLRNTGEQQGALISAGLFDRRFAAHERLTMPVLVLSGRYDGVIGVDAPRELARTLPSARFVEYERSAHFPYLEEPDRFARDVIAFLTEPRN